MCKAKQQPAYMPNMYYLYSVKSTASLHPQHVQYVKQNNSQPYTSTTADLQS